MRIIHVHISLVAILLLGQSAIAAETTVPKTIYWEGSQISQAKANQDKHQKTLSRLQKLADKALEMGPFSVTNKETVPPSGDKHDYLSYSRYWWPNPETENGLPYVRRDGQVNKELRGLGDRNEIGKFTHVVEILALASYFFEEEKYADRALDLIQIWFLDDETKMNPHLKYGQGVPGRAEGRGVGILDTRSFIKLFDSLALLSESNSYQKFNPEKLHTWFTEYLSWLRTSELGQDEAEAKNNHGSWYAAQVACIAMFLGEEKIAREIVEGVKTQRIPSQFAANGSLPFELIRTQSLHYSFFNLEALSVVARAGEHLGVDLWHNRKGEPTLKQGLDFILPYASHEAEWPYPQIKTYSLSPSSICLLRMASERYSDSNYLKPISKTPHRHPELDFSDLLFHASTKKHKISNPTITITENTTPTATSYSLPEISIHTTNNLIQRLPQKRDGVAEVGSTFGESILTETFRKDRIKNFQRMQQRVDTQVIKLHGGAIALEQVASQINDESVLEVEDGIATVRLPLLIQPDATLICDGKGIHEVRLSTNKGALIANGGKLYILNTKVTSWDEGHSSSTPFQGKKKFRPFISSYIRSETYFGGSTFHDLGYHAPTSYGISLSSQPERHQPEKLSQWPSGTIVDCEFHGLYYGFYSYEARDVKIINNKYQDCILYGIDPHDRSTELIIAGNTTTGTKERHGIIGSREINNSYIFDNVSFGNAGSGIMLDRMCTDNLVCENTVYNNGQGIAIYESSSNIVANNLVVKNKKSGIRVRNSDDVEVIGNRVVGNGDYGFEVYAKRLNDHERRTRPSDAYQEKVSVTAFNNSATGNEGGLLKGMHVTQLTLYGVDTDVDLSQINQTTGLAIDSLETEDDHTFGSQLKKHSETLRKVFERSKPLIEFSGADSD